MNKSKQLIDGALMTAVFIVMLLVTIFAPVISVLTLIFLAVPFVIFAAKHDWKPSLLMFTVAILLSILFATFISIPLTVLAGIGGIVIGSAIYQERSPYETLARGTVGYAIGILLLIVFNMVLLDVNIIDEFNQEMDEAIETSKELVADFGMGQVSEKDLMLIEQQLNVSKQLIPVGIAIFSLALALLNQWLSYKLLNRIDRKRLQFPKFRNFRFPISVIWIYLLAMVLSLFQTDPNSTVFIALQNVIILTGLLLALQGISFIFFFAHHKNITIAMPIIVTIITIVFAPLLLPLVRILGIIDLGFGMRDRMVK
ncbi:YybS family protein [Ornithinibacillus scapharcae]|uniref:YybS family protein n=1 Tax=Ornithinibacillus scapharcae TaxID=1147159 RepID=UPI000225B806|nr:YybS family protein [Ornithinibacillus scapharcae]